MKRLQPELVLIVFVLSIVFPILYGHYSWPIQGLLVVLHSMLLGWTIRPQFPEFRSATIWIVCGTCLAWFLKQIYFIE